LILLLNTVKKADILSQGNRPFLCGDHTGTKQGLCSVHCIYPDLFRCKSNGSFVPKAEVRLAMNTAALVSRLPPHNGHLKGNRQYTNLTVVGSRNKPNAAIHPLQRISRSVPSAVMIMLLCILHRPGNVCDHLKTVS